MKTAVSPTPLVLLHARTYHVLRQWSRASERRMPYWRTPPKPNLMRRSGSLLLNFPSDLCRNWQWWWSCVSPPEDSRPRSRCWRRNARIWKTSSRRPGLRWGVLVLVWPFSGAVFDYFHRLDPTCRRQGHQRPQWEVHSSGRSQPYG